jgi:hypothetical protein
MSSVTGDAVGAVAGGTDAAGAEAAGFAVGAMVIAWTGALPNTPSATSAATKADW